MLEALHSSAHTTRPGEPLPSNTEDQAARFLLYRSVLLLCVCMRARISSIYRRSRDGDAEFHRHQCCTNLGLKLHSAIQGWFLYACLTFSIYLGSESCRNWSGRNARIQRQHKRLACSFERPMCVSRARGEHCKRQRRRTKSPRGV